MTKILLHKRFGLTKILLHKGFGMTNILLHKGFGMTKMLQHKIFDSMSFIFTISDYALGKRIWPIKSYACQRMHKVEKFVFLVKL